MVGLRKRLVVNMHGYGAFQYVDLDVSHDPESILLKQDEYIYILMALHFQLFQDLGV